jgi:Flp pilus assembly CpaE family ATPase
MLEERQSMHDYFRQLLLTVVGQAYGAAGYTLEEAPLKWIAGNFRFIKTLDDGFFAYIDYQVLVYSENEHVDRLPSRFVSNLRAHMPNIYAPFKMFVMHHALWRSWWSKILA